MMKVLGRIGKVRCDNAWERGLFEGRYMKIESVQERDGDHPLFIGKVLLHGSDWDVRYPADQIQLISSREQALVDSMHQYQPESSLLHLLGDKLYQCLINLDTEVKSCEHIMELQDFNSAEQLIQGVEYAVSSEGDYEDFLETKQKINQLWEKAEALLRKIQEREGFLTQK